MNDEYAGSQIGVNSIYGQLSEDCMYISISEIENGFLIHYRGSKDDKSFSKVRYVAEVYWLGSEIATIWDEFKTKAVVNTPSGNLDDLPF
jgi:hypothetical protein